MFAVLGLSCIRMLRCSCCLAPGFLRVGSLFISVVFGLFCARIFTGWIPCYSSGSWSVLRPDFHGLGPLLFQWFLVCLAPGFSRVGSLVISEVLGLSCARIFTGWIPCYSCSGSWSVLRPDFHGLGPF